MVDVTTLSQTDPRWKDNPLGFDTSTIGSYGCLLTSMTMVANCYGFSETPETVNEKMKKVQGFQGALVMPAVLPAALPGIVYRNFINCQNTPAPLAEIDASLAQGKPVVVEVDYAPTPGLQNHWIVLYEKRGSDYLLRDPWPYPPQTGEVTLLTSRYKFGGTPEKIIQGVVFLDGSGATAAAQAPQAVNLDQGVRASFPVYATADGLALRSATLVADNTLLKRVPLGTKLTVLESDTAAKAKLGVLNQWLAVLDPSDNTQGYTAAWYVSAEALSKPDVSPASAAQTPQNLIVKTTDEGVALRSKPEISDAALLKRVPVNTELICSEPFAQAEAKVGVVYQWLQVKDVTNCDYYVAAWYVQAVNGQATLGVKAQSSAAFGLPEAEVGPLVVRAAAEGLALRSHPLIMAETLLKRLPIDGELVVLEDPQAAEGKLGRMGEWLHVRDVAGTEGYVAAWYAVRRPELALTADSPLLG